MGGSLDLTVYVVRQSRVGRDGTWLEIELKGALVVLYEYVRVRRW